MITAPPMSSDLRSAASPRVADAAARAAATIAVPKSAPADSFVLHAPLELLARVGLVPYVAPDRRDDAIAMIDRLADQYEASGDPVAEPAPMALGDPVSAARRLVDALGEGDLDRVDSSADALLSTVSFPEAAGLLAGHVITSLAAAGHAPIGFALGARVRPALSPSLLRGALRGIATRPDWQVRWHVDHVDNGDPNRLYEALRSVPRLGSPGSDFIHPLMSQVQDGGLAEALLAPVLADRFDVTGAARTLTRVAAWSMVHDDPAHAPYGWSHALTMPQAVMNLAGAGVPPRLALAVAATFTAGFRAAHSQVDLPAVIVPGSMPDVTAAELATAASLHEDAHLVKFTLACLHAAADDPRYRSLYLSAALRLVTWWNA
ncbi:MAG: hypothetical protein HY828_18535 [Actinobacteria bacterium]|nr:hypothetical protein [Actinomycetota bacterium]